MPSLRELKTRWQIRFRDSGRDPTEASVSVPKSLFRTEAQAEAEMRRLEHLWLYEDYDPWTMQRPRREATDLTVDQAAQDYLTAKKRAGERGGGAFLVRALVVGCYT